MSSDAALNNEIIPIMEGQKHQADQELEGDWIDAGDQEPGGGEMLSPELFIAKNFLSFNSSCTGEVNRANQEHPKGKDYN